MREAHFFALGGKRFLQRAKHLGQAARALYAQNFSEWHNRSERKDRRESFRLAFRGGPNPQIDSIYKILYITSMATTKPIEFLGRSLDDLRGFPLAAKREAGHQLDKVQHGHEPDDWKPMNTIGKGVKEIRIRDTAGAFRVIYVAKFADAVYVLHCFQKKAERTSKTDLDLAQKRYLCLLQELEK